MLQSRRPGLLTNNCVSHLPYGDKDNRFWLHNSIDLNQSRLFYLLQLLISEQSYQVSVRYATKCWRAEYIYAMNWSHVRVQNGWCCVDFENQSHYPMQLWCWSKLGYRLSSGNRCTHCPLIHRWAQVDYLTHTSELVPTLSNVMTLSYLLSKCKSYGFESKYLSCNRKYKYETVLLIRM